MSMLVFLSIAGICFLVLIVSLIFGGDGDFEVDHSLDFDGGADLDGGTDLDAGDGGPGWFNINVIAVFGTVFGAVGSIARAYKLSDPWTYGSALVCGLLLAYLVRKFISLFYSQQATSTYSVKSLEGKTGTVTLGILAGKTGQVTVEYGESYITKSARSVDGSEIKQGESVVVVQTGSPLIVKLNR